MFNFMRRKFSKSAPLPMMFIVGTGSKHANIELRYALRSVSKFGTGISRMIVAETLAEPGAPSAIDWLSQDVEHILIDPFIDLRGRNRNITLTVLEGVRRANLTGDFILGIDDVFLTRQTDFSTLPTYAAAQHLPTVNPTGGSWGAAMVECGQWLRAHGYPDVNFMTHAHVRMSADTIRRHYDEILRTATTSETVRGFDILSLVGNMSLHDGRFPSPSSLAIRADFKLTELDLIGVTDCFSIADKIFDDPRFVTYMDGIYPAPSRYESPASSPVPSSPNQ